MTWTGFRPSDDPCVYHYNVISLIQSYSFEHAHIHNSLLSAYLSLSLTYFLSPDIFSLSPQIPDNMLTSVALRQMAEIAQEIYHDQRTGEGECALRMWGSV